jgi:glycosyltransferase involved in cell wall biosynthesis
VQETRDRILKARSKAIGLVIYSDPNIFPPTVNAANILQENGWQVYLYGIRYPQTPEKMHLHKNVKLVYVAKHSTGWRNFASYLKMIFTATGLAFKKTDILIGYDAAAVLPAYIASKLSGKKWVYHQHDYFEFPKTAFQRLVLRAEHKLGSRADLVVFPQVQRAEIFSQKNSMQKQPLIVFNGPRKSWIKDIPPMHPSLQRIRKQYKFLLVYQGGWSKFFGIENLVKAVKQCRSDVGVVFLGKELEPGIKQFYKEMIAGAAMPGQFEFIEFLPNHEDLPSVTAYCDLGIAKLTNDKDKAPLNDKFLIGASNKITEYLACGLPVITSRSIANEVFFNLYPIGRMCDVENSREFADTIDALLGNTDELNSIKENNKRLFREKLNYDDQFSPLLQKLNSLLDDN